MTELGRFFDFRGRCLRLIDIDGFEQDLLEDKDTGEKVNVTTIMFKGYTTQIPDPDSRVYNVLKKALRVCDVAALKKEEHNSLKDDKETG